MVCDDCGCKFSIGARLCPQCTSENAHMEGDDMSPKITRHGGASYAEDVEGNEWDGSKPSTSSEKDETTGSDSSPSDQSPAPTTENPSTPDLTESSSADSTDGESADAPADPYEGLTKTELQDELVKRDLPKSGNVAELADRLRAHDAELEAADAEFDDEAEE